MLKQLLLVFTLFAVMPAVCMEYVIRVPKTTVKITTQDGQEFEVDKEQVKCSETLKNLIVGDAGDDVDSEVFRDGIPLPNVTGPIWAKIQKLLPLVQVFNKPVGDDLQEEDKQNAQQEKEATKADIIAKLKSNDGTTLIDFIAAVNYLDIPILLNLAIDVAKQMDIKKVTFAQIATLPWPICKSIILGQMARTFGPLLGKQLGICNGHTDSVYSACVTPNGRRIVSRGQDGTIRIWDMNNLNERPVVLRGRTDMVASVCVTPDGSKMVSCGYGKIHVWNMNNLNNLTEPPIALRNFWVNSLCVTPDGSRLVGGCIDGIIRVWNMNNLTEPPIMLTGHTDMVASVCVTPDGNKTVSGSSDGTIRVWNMNNLTEPPVMLTGHTDMVASVCVTPDGSKIVSCGEDGTIRVWNMNNLTEPPVMLTGHTDMVDSVCVTPDGSKIVSGGLDGTIRVWDISLLNRISTMDFQEAQAVWQYLQNDHAKNWDRIRAILGIQEPVNWVTRTAAVLGAGAVIGVFGWCAYKWFANNSNE